MTLRLFFTACLIAVLPLLATTQTAPDETKKEPASDNTAIEVIADVDFDQSVVDEGKKIFNTRCSACHRIGGGKLVGPDLKDVPKHRQHEWLIGFIRNSQEMIQAGDKDAVAIFNEYNQMVMPPHPDLDEEKINAIMEYILSASTEVADAIASVDGKMPRDVVPAIAGPSLKPTDFEFRLIYWFSAGLIILMALIGAGIIARFSKEDAKQED